MFADKILCTNALLIGELLAYKRTFFSIGYIVKLDEICSSGGKKQNY